MQTETITHSIPIIGDQPNVDNGINYINTFIQNVKYLSVSGKNETRRHFQRIFGVDRAEYMHSDFIFMKLDEFFLELDCEDQISFLSDNGFYESELELPVIKKWFHYGELSGFKYKPFTFGTIPNFTMEDVRKVATKYFNEWDLYPHPLVFVRAFLAFIADNDYLTESPSSNFNSNYPEVSGYFTILPVDKQQQFVKSIIEKYK